MPLAHTLQVLHTQVLALVLDTTPSEREASCRKAAKALERAGLGDDVNASNLGFLARLHGFDARRALANRNRVSERIAALAMWKWLDLHDELRLPRSKQGRTEVVDGLLSTISVLIFEAAQSLTGELEAMSDQARQEADATRKRRISQVAHAGKQLLHERTRRLLVDYAMQLRSTKPNRSDAVRATLRRFELVEAYVPKPRTLHEWLKAEGWARDASPADR